MEVWPIFIAIKNLQWGSYHIKVKFCPGLSAYGTRSHNHTQVSQGFTTTGEFPSHPLSTNQNSILCDLCQLPFWVYTNESVDTEITQLINNLFKNPTYYCWEGHLQLNIWTMSIKLNNAYIFKQKFIYWSSAYR